MVKIETGHTPYNPEAFRGKETFDRLGSYIGKDHRIIAELMPMPSGEQVWEIRCDRCRHGYVATGSQLSLGRGMQPCRCTMRKNR